MFQKGDEPVPGYRLEAFLGRGQFGEVWRATAPGRASVALKFLNLTERQGLKEYRAIQQFKSVRHPHLAPVTAFWLLDEHGEVLDDESLDRRADLAADPAATLHEPVLPGGLAETRPIASRLVVATVLCDRNLAERMKQCQQEGLPGIPREELLRYMEEAAKGIDFLNAPRHDLGEGPVAIQHCDIKPENIMLTGDSVMICDFGVARFLAAGATAATGTSMAGSLAYMSPESIQSKPGHASDQYSLAVSYAELRGGRLPFRSETWLDVLEAHRSGDLDLSAVPPAERDVLHKATAVHSADRYPSASAMVAALRAAVPVEVQAAAGEDQVVALQGQAVALPEQQVAPPRREPSRSKLLLGAVAAVGLLFAGWVLSDFWPSTDRGESPLPRTLRFRVVPPDATVRVDGELVSAGAAGEVVLQRAGDSPLAIEAWKRPQYRDWARTVPASELAAGSMVIRLEPERLASQLPAHEFASRAFAIADADASELPRLDEAIAAYRAAMEIDEVRYASAPPSVRTLHDPGEDYRLSVRSMALGGEGGEWLAARSGAREISLWQLADLDRPRIPLHEHAGPVFNLVTAGPLVASADLEGRVWVGRLDAAGSVRPVEISPQLRGLELAISPDLRWLVTGDFEGGVRACRLDASAPSESPRELGVQASDVRAIAVTADSRRAISAGGDGSIRAWNLDGPDSEPPDEPLAELGGEIFCTAMSVDGRFAAYGGEGRDGEPGQVSLVDLAAGKAIVLSEHATAGISALAFDPIARQRGDGRAAVLLASGSEAGDVQVVGVPDGLPLQITGRTGSLVRSLAFCRPEGWLVSGGDDGSVALWNLGRPDRGPMLLRASGERVIQVLVTPRWIIACSSTGALQLWSLPRCILVKATCDALGIEPRGAAERPATVTT